MAAKIPLDLRLSLREGSIFYLQDRKLTSPEPHFHIVVNADPLGQEVLLLSVVTSKVEKVKFRCRDRLHTIVEMTPADLPEVLTKDSIVDCNELTRVSLEEFCERWTRKEIKIFGTDLPETLRRIVRGAIHASDILADELKALVALP